MIGANEPDIDKTKEIVRLVIADEEMQPEEIVKALNGPVTLDYARNIRHVTRWSSLYRGATSSAHLSLASLGLGPDDKIVDLAPRLRCRECDEKGKAAVAVKWAQS
jgi:hypothetical protein